MGMSSIIAALMLLLLAGNAIYTVYPTAVVVSLTIEAKGKIMVTVNLEGSPEQSTLLVFDEKGLPLPYDFNGTSITVYALNSTKVNIIYEATKMLHYNEDKGVWRLDMNPTTECKVILPPNSIVLYYSSTGKLMLKGSTPILFFEKPGKYTIKFSIVSTVTIEHTEVVPTTPTQTATTITISEVEVTTTPVTQTTSPTVTAPFKQTEIALIVAVLALLIAILAFAVKRK